MTQEVFLTHAKHFVELLPTDHEPVILFLDGHASRWNKYALKYFMDHRVYTFFLASHMSIWAQPNDTGVNKRFHSSIEEACREVRRKRKVATIYHFNSNFARGWREFLSREHEDLRCVGVNSATNTFKRTRLFPYNPHAEAWTEAIQTIGQGEKPKAGTQYEVFPNKDCPTLTASESTILRDGMNLEGIDIHFQDLEVAKIKGMHILAQWRDDIAKGVSEGNDEETYANTLLPSPKTEAEKVAMWLIHFEKIDSKSLWLACAADKTKEEKAAEIMHQIVLSTKISEPIKVTYLLSPLPSDAESSSDDNSEMTKTSCGTAVKEGETSGMSCLTTKQK